MKYSTAQFHLFNWLSFRVLLLLSRTRFTHVSPQKLKINKFLQTLLEISQKLSKVKGG